jgi:hypothetical protein
MFIYKNNNKFERHRWRSGKRARLECSRPRVLAQVGSNQRLYNWYMLLLP